MSDFNTGLNAAQIELLDMLQEECAEVIQIVAKMKRHGPMSYHPGDPSKVPNYELMCRELGDVFGVVAALDEKGMILRAVVENFANTKMQRAAPYLHHQS